MNGEQVLRFTDESGTHAVRVELSSDGQMLIQDAGAEARPLKVLRREAGGLRVVLWGDQVISGLVSVDETGLSVMVPHPAGHHATGLTLKPAAVDAMEQAAGAAGSAGGVLAIHSPIPGLVKAVQVKPGDSVTVGQTVVVLEAMKMENEIPAPKAGHVLSVEVQAGQTVAAGATLIKMET